MSKDKSPRTIRDSSWLPLVAVVSSCYSCHGMADQTEYDTTSYPLHKPRQTTDWMSQKELIWEKLFLHGPKLHTWIAVDGERCKTVRTF